MTELDLYKYCQDKEMSWEGEELVIWIGFHDLEEFVKLIGYSLIADDGGLQVHLQECCIVLDLVEICEHHDIDPNNILNDYSKADSNEI